MSDIRPVSRALAPEYAAPATLGRIQGTSTITRGQDQVSLSDSARIFSAAKENPIRQDLVARVKAEIAAGTYETEAKFDAAVDAAFADLS